MYNPSCITPVVPISMECCRSQGKRAQCRKPRVSRGRKISIQIPSDSSDDSDCCNCQCCSCKRCTCDCCSCTRCPTKCTSYGSCKKTRKEKCPPATTYDLVQQILSKYDCKRLNLITERMKVAYCLEESNDNFCKCKDPCLKTVILRKIDQNMCHLKDLDVRICKLEQDRASEVINEIKDCVKACLMRRMNPSPPQYCVNGCPIPARGSPRAGNGGEQQRFGNNSNSIGNGSGNNNNSSSHDWRRELDSAIAVLTSEFLDDPKPEAAANRSVDRKRDEDDDVESFTSVLASKSGFSRTKKRRRSREKTLRVARIPKAPLDLCSTSSDEELDARARNVTPELGRSPRVRFDARVCSLPGRRDDPLDRSRRGRASKGSNSEATGTNRVGSDPEDPELTPADLEYLFRQVEQVAIDDAWAKGEVDGCRRCAPRASGLYRASVLSLPVRREVLSAVRRRSPLWHVSPSSVATVLMEQLERRIRRSSNGCILSESMLTLRSPTFFKITTLVSPETRDLWQRTFSHMVKMAASETTPIEALADAFAPLLIQSESRMFIQAASLVSRLLRDELEERPCRDDSWPVRSLGRGTDERTGERRHVVRREEAERDHVVGVKTEKPSTRKPASPEKNRKNSKRQNETELKPTKLETETDTSLTSVLPDSLPPDSRTSALPPNRDVDVKCVGGGDSRPKVVPDVGEDDDDEDDGGGGGGDDDDVGDNDDDDDGDRQEKEEEEENRRKGDSASDSSANEDGPKVDDSPAELTSTFFTNSNLWTLSLTQTAAYQKLLTDTLASSLKLSESGSEEELERNVRMIASGHNNTTETIAAGGKTPYNTMLTTTKTSATERSSTQRPIPSN